MSKSTRVNPRKAASNAEIAILNAVLNLSLASVDEETRPSATASGVFASAVAACP
jgi:hypothetical protein